MVRPTKLYWKEEKHVLRYLRGITQFGYGTNGQRECSSKDSLMQIGQGFHPTGRAHQEGSLALDQQHLLGITGK